MTTSLHPPTPIPDKTTGEALGNAAGKTTMRFGKRVLLGLLLILVIFLVAYAIAWFNAYQLSQRFFQDAKATYKTGDYLKALVGYQEFDPQTNKYLNYGGYVLVGKIWSSRYSWPAPSFVQLSQQRTLEIIDQKLTADQALQYIQENTGRPGTPYFAEIYLRLGELFEQQGDIPAAKDVYQSLPSQFPNRKDLIEQAQQHLQKLQNAGK